tara:strand:+ start:229 stop:549 length:321 start_codon:yes stop_codon:yes gene_type:complete
MTLQIGVFCDENRNSRREIMKIMFFKRSSSKYRPVFCLLAIILWFLMITGSLLLSVIFLIVCIVPIYISIFFVLFRMIWWWNRKRRIEVAQKTASEKDNSYQRVKL